MLKIMLFLSFQNVQTCTRKLDYLET